MANDNTTSAEVNGGTPFAEARGSTENAQIALFHIKEAITMLRDNYPRWNEAGKEHAVNSAAGSCEQAWRHLNHFLSNAEVSGQPPGE